MAREAASHLDQSFLSLVNPNLRLLHNKANLFCAHFTQTQPSVAVYQRKSYNLQGDLPACQ